VAPKGDPADAFLLFPEVHGRPPHPETIFSEKFSRIVTIITISDFGFDYLNTTPAKIHRPFSRKIPFSKPDFRLSEKRR
jgi:hypothetical protein